VKRLVISTSVAALIAGGAGFAFAGQPGPNGHNDYGLCKAYSAGSANGQAHKHQAPPFAALEDAANAAYPNADSTADAVAQYCSTVTPGGK
jgi:hypothetical protein